MQEKKYTRKRSNNKPKAADKLDCIPVLHPNSAAIDGTRLAALKYIRRLKPATEESARKRQRRKTATENTEKLK
jgi:hypothetical protein